MQYDVKVKNRLKRTEGQIRGIMKMLDEEKDCKAVITQLSAARAAIDRTIGVIVSTNLEQCVLEYAQEGKSSSEVVEEAVRLLVNSR